MTSVERREHRYQRRKQRREEKKWQSCRQYDNFRKVFSYGHLYQSYRKCRRNVAWKASVQRYIVNAPLLVYRTRKKLLTKRFKSKGFFEFDIMERGKRRHIKSVIIAERVVQRCLCDHALVPMLSRRFIYDNGASLKDKGYHFTMDRLTEHLHEYYRQYGGTGYILTYDFHGFFDHILHALCISANHREFTDADMLWITDYFVLCFGGGMGLGLGSQVSQTYALEAANPLDHYVKESLRIKQCARYMDDGYLIHPDKDYLHNCLAGIMAVTDSLGIEINQKKTRITKLSHGFVFMKARYSLTDTGKVVKRIYKHSVTAERRKLKKFTDDRMPYEDIRASFCSWYSYAEHFAAWHTLQNMTALFNRLYLEPFIHGKVTAMITENQIIVTENREPDYGSLLIYYREEYGYETDPEGQDRTGTD